MKTIIARIVLNSDEIALYNAFKDAARDEQDVDKYLNWRQAGLCTMVIAHNKEQALMGHAVILWKSRFKPHLEQCIPEVMDVYTYFSYRRQGVARALLNYCETVALQRHYVKIGLGVLSMDENNQLHGLYLTTGYCPNGMSQLSEGKVFLYEKTL